MNDLDPPRRSGTILPPNDEAAENWGFKGQRMQGQGSSLSRRGRATLIWAVGIFAAAQLSLAAAIEFWLPQLRDPIYGDKLNQLRHCIAEAPSGTPLVVMLGSSRAVHGLDAGLLERQLAKRLGRQVIAYNFGIPGAGPFTELVCLKRLLAEGIRPDLALIEVLPPMLAGQTPSFDLGQFPADRIWLRETPLIERYTDSIFPQQRLTAAWWSGWWTPAHTHRFAVMRVACPQFVPPEGRGHLFAQFDDRGWNAMPEQVRTPDRVQAALETARKEYAGILSQFELGGASCQALGELLDLCNKEQIPAALVLMPEGQTFRSWYPSMANSEIEAFLSQLSERYDAQFINARDWIAEQRFLDSHHLLAPGSQEFSLILSRRAALPFGTVLTAGRPSAGSAEPAQQR